MILLDNWSINISIQSIKYIKQTLFRFITLPHYFSSLALIEITFAKLKKIVLDMAWLRLQIENLGNKCTI